MNKPSKDLPIHIFTGSTSTQLAVDIATILGINLGVLKLHRYSDGELHPVLGTDIYKSHVYLIQTTTSPSENIIELLLMINAAQQAGAQYITVVIPYFGYMRQDKAHHTGGSIAGPLMMRLIHTAGASSILTCDLHNLTLMNAFQNKTTHIPSSAIFFPYIKTLALDNLMIATPDEGRKTSAQYYAEKLNVPLIKCQKNRDKANKITFIIPNKSIIGANIVLIDDIIDTGATLSICAEILQKKGAHTVRACCTHAVLSRNAYKTLSSSVLEKIAVSSTISIQKQHPKIQVVSAAPAFAKAIQEDAHNTDKLICSTYEAYCPSN